MAELKTRRNDQSVEKFLQGIADEKRHMDCNAVLELMKEITGETPKMWGDIIAGFGFAMTYLCIGKVVYREIMI